MKKLVLFVFAIMISVVFAGTGFTQDKPAAAPEKPAAAAEKKDEKKAEKKAKKDKKADKKAEKKEAKPEEKPAAPAEKK